MATKKKQVMSKIEPGTPEMADRLSVGYGMTLDEAKEIIVERKNDPASHPYERMRNAQAFLEAYDAVPQVISTTPGWKRNKGR